VKKLSNIGGDLSEARAKLFSLLTELRLVADQPVYERAGALCTFLFEFGEKVLVRETPPPVEKLLKLKEALIEAVRTDLGI
jgi:hypothetical protein